MNESDNIPKANVTVLCGLAVNVSPVPDAMFGNLKLRWCQNPMLYANSVVRHIDYETGQVFFNDNVSKETFQDLRLSYLFKFNSVQLLLMCWGKGSEKINENNIVLSCQYPYHLMKAGEIKAQLPYTKKNGKKKNKNLGKNTQNKKRINKVRKELMYTLSLRDLKKSV